MIKFLKKKFQSLSISKSEQKKALSEPISQKLIDIKDDIYSKKAY